MINVLNVKGTPMADPIYKKVELVGTSKKSLSDAINNAVSKISKSVRNTSWFEVVEQRGSISNGKVTQYQVTIRVGFRVD